MKCVSCGSHKMTSSTGAYRYDLGLDQKIVLLNIPINRCPDCGEEEVGIPRVEELHKTVARAVASKIQRLTPREIRFLRKYLELTNIQLAELIGVAPETASRWQSDKGSNIGLVAERLLRLLVLERSGKDILHTTAKTPSSPLKSRFRAAANQWEAA